jgi:hypothetical protein
LFGIAQVGNTIVIGDTFTQVAGQSAATRQMFLASAPN